MFQKKKKRTESIEYFLFFLTMFVSLTSIFFKAVSAFIVTPNVYFSNPSKNITLSFNYPVNFSNINITLNSFVFDNYSMVLSASGKTNIVFYNLTPLYRVWIENYSSLGIIVNHTFNIFPPNESIVLLKDGKYYETLKSNASGFITFITNSTENVSEYTLLIDKVPPIITNLTFSKYVAWLHPQTIVCEAKDNIKVNTTEIFIDGVLKAKCYSDICQYTRKETVAKTHYIECLAIDSSGNRASKETEYVVYYPSGGSSSSTQPAAIKHEAMFYLINLPPHKKAVFNITDKAIPIKEISIIPKSEIKSAKIVVELDERNPVNVDIKNAYPYSFLTINHTDLNLSEIESVNITFEVNKSWLSTTTVNANDMFLFRFENDGWVKMPTRLIEETENTYIYKAVVPGLSYYAIALIIPQKQTPLKNEKNKSVNLPPKQTTPKTQVAKECMENAKRCVGNIVEICRNGHWQILKTCKYGCNPKTFECIQYKIKQKNNNRNKLVVVFILFSIIVLISIYIFFILHRQKSNGLRNKKSKKAGKIRKK